MINKLSVSLSFTLVLLIFTNTYSQDKPLALEAVPELALTSEVTSYNKKLIFNGTGLNFTLPMNVLFDDIKNSFLGNINLNWNLLAGSNSNGDFYIHANGGSTFFSQVGASNSATYLLIALLVLPEGISYHIPVDSHFRVSTFFNPFGGDYWKDKNQRVNYGTGTSTMDCGIKPTYITKNKITLGVTLGYKLIYTDNNNRGFYGGINIGWQLY